MGKFVKWTKPTLICGNSGRRRNLDATIGAAVGQLDVRAVITAAQAVSGEIVLDPLIETLMTIALKNAGAQRGLLILLQGETARMEAEGSADQNTVKVPIRREAVTQADIPPNPFSSISWSGPARA